MHRNTGRQRLTLNCRHASLALIISPFTWVVGGDGPTIIAAALAATSSMHGSDFVVSNAAPHASGTPQHAALISPSPTPASAPALQLSHRFSGSPAQTLASSVSQKALPKGSSLHAGHEEGSPVHSASLLEREGDAEVTVQMDARMTGDDVEG